MNYEVEFYIDNIKHTAQVTAPDEETAILLAGMQFSDMDLNTDSVHSASVVSGVWSEWAGGVMIP